MFFIGTLNLSAIWLFTRIYLVFPVPWVYGSLTVALTGSVFLVFVPLVVYMMVWRFPSRRQLHKKLDKVHKRSRIVTTCEWKDCSKIATWGVKDQLAKYCHKHGPLLKEKGMEYLPRNCEKCGEEATHGRPGAHLQHCESHRHLLDTTAQDTTYYGETSSTTTTVNPLVNKV